MSTADGQVDILVVPEFDDFNRDLQRGVEKAERRAPAIEVPVEVAPRSFRNLRSSLTQLKSSVTAGGLTTIPFTASATGMRAKLFSRVQEAVSRARQAALIPFTAITKTILPAITQAVRSAVTKVSAGAKIVFTAVTSGIVPAVAAATQKAVATAQAQLATLQRSAAATGAAISSRLTVPILAVGGLAVKLGVDFESGMLKVQALTRATGDELDTLSNLAKELGRTTQFSASEAADAMGFLAQAGFDTNEIIATLPDTLNLAAAAELDLASAADIVSNILSGYGIATEDLAAATDTLTNAFSSTNQDLTQLGEAFKTVGPIASNMGVDINTAAAAIGAFSDAGIQGGEAGTALRNILLKLANPTTSAAAAIEDLGVQIFDADGEMRDIVDIMDDFGSAGLDASQASEIFGLRTSAAAVIMSQSTDAIRDNAVAFAEQGAAAEQAALRMSGTRGALLRLKSAAEGVFIAIGESGLLDSVASLAERVAGLASRAAEASPGILKMVTSIALGAAAFGPMLKVVGALLAPLRAVLAVVALLASPMGLLVAAIALVGAAIATTFLPGLNTLEGKLGAIRDILANQVVPWFRDEFVPALVSVGQTVARNVVPFLTRVGEIFIQIVQGVQAFMGAWRAADGDVTSAGFPGFMERVANIIQSQVVPAIRKVIDFFNDMLPTLTKVGKALLALGRSGLKLMVTLLPKVAKAIRGVLKFLDDLIDFRKVFEGIATVIGGVVDFVRNLVDAFTSLVDGDFSGFLDGLLLSFGSIVDILGGVLEVVIGLFGELGARILAAIGDLGGIIWNGIKSGFNTVTSNVGSFIGDVIGFFTSLPGQIIAGLGDIGNAIWNGIKAGLQTVLANIGAWTADVVGFFITLPIQIVAAFAQLNGLLIGAVAQLGATVTPLINGFISDVVQFFIDLPGQIIAGIGNLGSTLWSAITSGLQTVITNLDNWALDAVQFFIDLPGQILAALGDLGGAIWDGISSSFTTLITNLTGVAGDMASAIGSFVTDEIPGLIADFASAALDLGSAFLEGLVDGISGAVGFVADIGTAVANAVINPINGIIDQVNDALEFTIPTGPLFPDININPPDIPNIPTFFHGGVFDGRDGMQFGGFNEPGNPEAVLPYTRPSDYLKILTDPRVAPATLHAADTMRGAADRIAAAVGGSSGRGDMHVTVEIDGGNVPENPGNLGMVIGNRVTKALEDVLR